MAVPMNKQAFWAQAFAFVLVAAIFVMGLALFTRMELQRETGFAIRHAGIAAALDAKKTTQDAQALIAARFAWQSRGVDKFGLPMDGKLSFSGVGHGLKTGTDLEAAILQLRGQVQKTGQPACAGIVHGNVCAVLHGSHGIRGVVIMSEPTQVMPLVWQGLAVLFAGILLLFLAIRFLPEGRLPGTSLVFFAMAVMGWLSWRYADIWLAGLSRAFGYTGHTAINGAGILLGPSIVAAGLYFALAHHIVDFLHELYEKPLVYAAISPAMIGMAVLVFIPFFMGVYIAFLDNNYNFIGLANFKQVLFPTSTSDTNFYFTFGVTVLWTALNVSLHVTIGLILALVLSDHRLREKAIYRVLLVVPWAVPSYITALIWKWMFNTQYGPINAFVKVLGLPAVDWLGRSFLTNFTANVVTNTWLGFPFMMVVSLGALQSIPSQLYEAAEIDGANRWQRFRHVTLPLLKPALFPAIILGTIWTFNMFNVVYLVSGGAPDNKTNILITEAYRSFRVLKNYGLAAAYSLLIFLILLAYSLITNKLTKGTEDIYA